MARKWSLPDLLSVRPKRRKVDVTEEADEAIDQALAHLAEATRQNENATKEVRKRQSSGKLMRIVSVRPPEAMPDT